jgi:hypothetical protein
MLDKSLDQPVADLLAAAIASVKEQTGNVDFVGFTAVPGCRATVRVRIAGTAPDGVSTSFTRTISLAPPAPAPAATPAPAPAAAPAASV